MTSKSDLYHLTDSLVTSLTTLARGADTAVALLAQVRDVAAKDEARHQEDVARLTARKNELEQEFCNFKNEHRDELPKLKAELAHERERADRAEARFRSLQSGLGIQPAAPTGPVYHEGGVITGSGMQKPRLT